MIVSNRTYATFQMTFPSGVRSVVTRRVKFYENGSLMWVYDKDEQQFMYNAKCTNMETHEYVIISEKIIDERGIHEWRQVRPNENHIHIWAMKIYTLCDNGDVVMEGMTLKSNMCAMCGDFICQACNPEMAFKKSTNPEQIICIQCIADEMDY